MWHKSSSYFFLVFLLISAIFASFIPTMRKAFRNTNTEYLKAQMQIVQANLILELGQEVPDRDICATEGPLSIQYFVTEFGDISKAYVCHGDDSHFALAVLLSDGQWYCVDSEDYQGEIENAKEMGNRCTS